MNRLFLGAVRLVALVALAAAPTMALDSFAGAVNTQSIVTVFNGQELRTYWADPLVSTIILGGNITLGSSPDVCTSGDPLRTSGPAIIVDGLGTFGITQTCVNQRVLRNDGTGAVTLRGLTTFTGGDSLGHGGGLRSASAVTVDNSTITANKAKDNTIGEDGDGGGIYADANITVTNSVISNNTAADDGGGVYTTDQLVVSGSIVSGNLAKGDAEGGGRGGGAYAEGSATVTNSTFSNNTAGGSNCETNFCDGTGGGLWTNDSATVTGSTFNANVALGDGGGVWSSGGVTVNSSTVSNNQALGMTESGDGTGGGFWTGGGITTITSSTFAGNTVKAEGGGFFVEADLGGGSVRRQGVIKQATGGTSVAITGSTFSGNTATQEGGAFTIDRQEISIRATNSTFTGNTSDHGAALDASSSGDVLTLVYVTISGNTVTKPVEGEALAATSVEPEGVSAFASGFGESANIEADILHAFGTVIANPMGGGPNCDIFNTTVSSGWNFSDDTSCGLLASTDKQGAGDPMLGSLASNGGPTQTMLPQTGSPLIDAIPTASCQASIAAGVGTDQRGITRPQPAGGLCDIGAVEVVPPTPPTPPTPPAVSPAVLVQPKFAG